MKKNNKYRGLDYEKSGKIKDILERFAILTEVEIFKRIFVVVRQTRVYKRFDVLTRAYL